MKIIDEKLLNRFRGPGPCELCGEWFASRQAHHFYFKRGMGGGSRLDVAINIAGVCGLCHNMAETGRSVEAIKQALLNKVAAREGRKPEDIVAELTKLKWSPK